ncbi:hypothetical protein GCM10017044_01270 [Kordiimonas sediminis]|uniref:SAF domain-containing protein n=1 Tax=Kordiimonas sediminis TaxID=1735581 RepID=A0A919AJA3_9PROT|nr:Flp pilus assembly protein CpaB [Kordiimonas sediminis]GHF11276.1 hypothetical protein GCM10017044_01270 [Kordiimonas sediminis]
MNGRNIILLIAAIVGVVLVVILTQSFLEGAQRQATTTAQRPVVANEQIMVAARKLPRGTILTIKDFKWQDWPKDAMNPAYLQRKTSKMEDLQGKVVLDTIAEAAPITQTSLVSMGQRGYMAAILTPGMRAVTIKLNSIAGVAGFIFPGDRVDLLLTQNIPDPKTGIAKNITETILENVRILGIDTRTEKAENVARPGKSATIEVTPKIAEKLAIVPRLGSLSLALRPLAQEGEPDDQIIETAVLERAYTESAEISRFRTKFNEESEEEKKKNTLIVRRGGRMRQMEIDADNEIDRARAQGEAIGEAYARAQQESATPVEGQAGDVDDEGTDP